MQSIPEDAKYFAKLDAVYGYFQLALDEESCYLTTFLIPSGRYRYLRAPMGLSSSSDEWCRYSDFVIEGCKFAKTRYMVFNAKTTENKLVKIGDEYLERVWKEGNEKSFKLAGIHVDEGLQWDFHINALGKKINSAIYGLAKTSRTLEEKSKKLLYSGLIHSHLVYGLPIWGFAKKRKVTFSQG